MITIRFDGEPVAKGRPRFRIVTSKAGVTFGSAYTPAKTRKFEDDFALIAKAVMRGRPPLEGPLQVFVDAEFAIPPSWPRHRRDAAMNGSLRPTSRPDWDNVAKGVLDALNGIAYRDDSQIVEAAIRKLYSTRPAVTVTIESL